MLNEKDIIAVIDELKRNKKYMLDNSPWFRPEFNGTTEQQEMFCKVAGYSQAIIDMGYYIARTYNMPEAHNCTSN